jgi:hypothetical protein
VRWCLAKFFPVFELHELPSYRQVSLLIMDFSSCICCEKKSRMVRYDCNVLSQFQNTLVMVKLKFYSESINIYSIKCTFKKLGNGCWEKCQEQVGVVLPAFGVRGLQIELDHKFRGANALLYRGVGGWIGLLTR